MRNDWLHRHKHAQINTMSHVSAFKPLIALKPQPLCPTSYPHVCVWLFILMMDDLLKDYIILFWHICSPQHTVHGETFKTVWRAEENSVNTFTACLYQCTPFEHLRLNILINLIWGDMLPSSVNLFRKTKRYILKKAVEETGLFFLDPHTQS